MSITLPKAKANNVGDANLVALIAQLRAENDALRAKQPRERAITFKVTKPREDGSGTTGALSVYGLGRFPITLYKSQWLRLIAAMGDLETFIADNADALVDKA